MLPGAPTLLLLSACQGGPTEPATEPPARSLPDLVVVTWDTVRADRVGDGRTPALEALAAEGTWFSQARSTSSTTLPGHASLLTGAWPVQHGARANSQQRLDPEVPVVAEALASGGYATGAFVSAAVISAETGLSRGFAHYDDAVSTDPTLAFAERRADATVDAALAWAAAAPADRPLFLWVHLFDPHQPWSAPAPYADAEPWDPYQAEIAWTDAQTGRLLDGLRAAGRLEPGAVVVTADHGESLGQHGEWTHGYYVYDATVRVPLVLWTSPGVAPARPDRSDLPVSIVDVAPTLAGLAGLSWEADGTDLHALLAEPEAAAARTLQVETVEPAYQHGTTPIFGAVRGGESFFDLPVPEIYDLGEDPGQTDNRFTPERAAEVAAVVGRSGQDWSPEAAEALDSATEARLAALGYVAAAEPTGAWTGDSDPKTRARMVWLQQTAGRNELPGAALAETLAWEARFGATSGSRDLKVHLLDRLGRVEEADAAIMVRDGERGAAEVARRQAARAEARALAGRIEQALAADPEHPSARFDLALQLRTLGEFGRARTLLDAHLARHPGDEEARLLMAWLWVAEDDPARAAAVLAAAPAQTPMLRCMGARASLLAGDTPAPEALRACPEAELLLVGRFRLAAELPPLYDAGPPPGEARP